MSTTKRGRNSGFALATLIALFMTASIMAAAALPLYRIQAKRAQEQELIFRGEEYMRAIQKFQRKFKTYPLSIDALLNTNGLRFLRKAYKDPITGKGFRLIYINPDGSLSGSTIFKQMMNDDGTKKVQSNTIREQFYQQQVTHTQQFPPSVDTSPAAAMTRWIIGVACDCDADSIMVYNNRKKYDEWEFIAIAQPGQPIAPPRQP